MDDDSPALGVGFAIDAGGSFDTLLQLQRAMSSTEGQLVRQAAEIEKATGTMFSPAGAAQISAFGNAATREMAAVRRATDQAERSGEAMVRQLQRQTETFGKTSSEIRSMRAEQRALAAEAQGLTELAGRIRALSSEMNALEANAAGFAGRGLAPVSANGKLASHHMQNLAFQFQDLGIQMVSAAGSSAPLKMAFMALMQQGTQIQGIMSQAGIGVRGVAGAFLDMSKSILVATATNPYLLAGAAAIGLFAGAVKALQGAANSGLDMKAYAEGLGLTAKEIRNLDNVTVTFGDTAKAVFQVAGRAIWDNIGPAVTGVWETMKDWAAWIFSGVKSAANFMIGAFIGGYNAIIGTYRQFPAALGDLFYSGVNSAIDAINGLVRKAVDSVNGYISSANGILGKVGLALPELSAPQIGRLENQYAGAAKKVGAAMKVEIGNAIGVDYLGDLGRKVGGAIIGQARENARNRIRSQAEDQGYLDPQKGSDRAKRLSDEAKAYEAAVKAANEYIAAVEKETARIGKSAKDIRLMEDAIARANAPLAEQKQRIDEVAAARERAYSAQATKDFQANVMQPLRDELALYGLVGPARAAAALELEKQAFIAKNMDDGIAVATARWEEYYRTKRELIGKDEAAAREAETIKRMREEIELMVSASREAGDAMAQAFGRVGGTIADVLDVFTVYAAKRKDLDAQVLAGTKTQADADKEAKRLQVQSFGALAGSAKQFFKEGSAGYQAMAAAEKAFALVQLANTAVNVAAGAAKMFASLGPFAFPAVAAMVGVMAGLGFFGGSSTSAAPPESNQGTGTVFGDAGAKSESIKRSIDQLREIDTTMLTFSREMAASLRSIDSQIGGFTNVILRNGDINASQGVTEGFKPNIIGSVLGAIPLVGGILKSLFGTTTKVLASGLYGNAQSLGSILSGGFQGQTYSDVEKKSKFLGITTSKKYRTNYGALDQGLEDQFTLVLKSFNDAIVAAAGPLGAATGEIQQRLNGFVLNIGKIDLKGLTGEQIEEKLTAIFGKAADQMAAAAFPGFQRFQRAGEGMFETLVRVASTVETVTAAMDQLGMGARVASMDAKIALAEQFESLSAMSSAVDGYFRAYYSKEEQTASQLAQFQKVFAGLGLALPGTLAGFRQLVEAQDLHTAAGRATYATLLQLAPAFADLQNALSGAKTAADIAGERADLERKLLELQGNTAALRALELAKLDASNRALQQQIWAMEDAQEAARAAEDLRKAWASVGDTIEDEIKRIRGLNGIGGEGSFAAIMAQFNGALAATRGGDIEAGKSLPGLSQSLLRAAELQATSRQELDRIRAQTAASLEAVLGSVNGMGGTSGTGSPASTTEALIANMAAITSIVTDREAANDDMAAELRALREEVAGMRKDNNAGHAATAGSAGRIAKKMDDVTAQSGGDAISTVQAA